MLTPENVIPKQEQPMKEPKPGVNYGWIAKGKNGAPDICGNITSDGRKIETPVPNGLHAIVLKQSDGGTACALIVPEGSNATPHIPFVAIAGGIGSFGISLALLANAGKKHLSHRSK